jgi:hypothetical protein
MCRASATRAHDTLSVAAGCGRRSTRSVMPHALYGLPHLRMMASSRRPRSASPPTTKDPPGGASWWFQRTTHRGSARRILRRRIESRPMRTALRGGRRSSARWYPMCPRPTPRVQRGRTADVQQPPGQPGSGIGTSLTGQPFARGQRSHGLRLGCHNPGRGDERGVQVGKIYVEPALVQPIQSACA